MFVSYFIEKDVVPDLVEPILLKRTSVLSSLETFTKIFPPEFWALLKVISFLDI